MSFLLLGVSIAIVKRKRIKTPFGNTNGIVIEHANFYRLALSCASEMLRAVCALSFLRAAFLETAPSEDAKQEYAREPFSVLWIELDTTMYVGTTLAAHTSKIVTPFCIAHLCQSDPLISLARI